VITATLRPPAMIDNEEIKQALSNIIESKVDLIGWSNSSKH